LHSVLVKVSSANANPAGAPHQIPHQSAPARLAAEAGEPLWDFQLDEVCEKLFNGEEELL